jgi:hypothetical protein
MDNRSIIYEGLMSHWLKRYRELTEQQFLNIIEDAIKMMGWFVFCQKIVAGG